MSSPVALFPSPQVHPKPDSAFRSSCRESVSTYLHLLFPLASFPVLLLVPPPGTSSIKSPSILSLSLFSSFNLTKFTMGSLVSFVLADHSPTTTTTLQDEAGPPSHIPIPPPPAIFGTWSLSPSPSYKDNPFDPPMPSPALQFYTAPSSPAVEVPSHSHTDHPPQPDLHIALPSSDPLPGLAQALEAESLRTDPTNEFDTIPNTSPHELPPEDPFPTADFTVDVSLDEEGLSTLEKIWLFSRSKARFHRIFIVHALPGFLHQVSPLEANEYVLPLLSGLATDEGKFHHLIISFFLFFAAKP